MADDSQQQPRSLNNTTATAAADQKKEQLLGCFDCNICMEMASDPVLTSCGHLYCWPCLYRWMYGDQCWEKKGCPVCKGELTEVNVTPIYGRGMISATGDGGGGRRDTDHEEYLGLGFEVPPRPHARRMNGSDGMILTLEEVVRVVMEQAETTRELLNTLRSYIRKA